MASRPPLGISLADAIGAPAQPQMGRGQIIAGILADALAGAMGKPGQFAQRLTEQQQAAQQEAQWGRHLMVQEQLKQMYPDPSPMERDVKAWQRMTDAQRTAYAELQKAKEGDPIVTITLPNSQIYSGPRSGLAAAMMGGGSGSAAVPTHPVGLLTPIDEGGPASQAPGGFPNGPYPNVGPYKRY